MGRGMRASVIRAVRVHPYGSTTRIAAAVGCHPSTVRKHVRAAGLDVPAAGNPDRDGTHSGEQPRQSAMLARDPDPHIRRLVAANPQLPPAAATRLARDPDPVVRQGRARRTSSQRLIARFLHDPTREVRIQAASNPACPPQPQLRLLTDPDPAVRAAVVPHHPGAIDAAGDPSPLVRRAAAAVTGLTASDALRLVADKDDGVREVLAANIHTPPALLRQLAGDPAWLVRCSVARNRSSPQDVLEQFASSISGTRDPHLRSVAARNKSTPPEVVARLLNDRDERTACAAADNSNCPPETLQAATSDKRVKVRVHVARNPNCTPETIDALARDRSVRVRRQVAHHPGCTTETLRRLYRDRDEGVRLTAADALIKRANGSSVHTSDRHTA